MFFLNREDESIISKAALLRRNSRHRLRTNRSDRFRDVIKTVTAVFRYAFFMKVIVHPVVRSTRGHSRDSGRHWKRLPLLPYITLYPLRASSFRFSFSMSVLTHIMHAACVVGLTSVSAAAQQRRGRLFAICRGVVTFETNGY